MFKKGFSLLELMVIVSIIGVLVAFAVPTYMGAQRRAQDNVAKSQLMLIQDAEKMHKLETGAYAMCTDNADCQDVLDIDLPQGTGDWQYDVPTAVVSPPSFCAQGIRFAREWHIEHDDEEPSGGPCP